ncbi:conserved hypothetical protein [Ricinus communis]|uniref:Uncharacterized protein n=1 Tax=Ricinus communis TaxID=3988 RepID=B9TB61_RICCO|nr:conserved hypothetical protein [Ricinus communis]
MQAADEQHNDQQRELAVLRVEKSVRAVFQAAQFHVALAEQAAYQRAGQQRGHGDPVAEDLHQHRQQADRHDGQRGVVAPQLGLGAAQDDLEARVNTPYRQRHQKQQHECGHFHNLSESEILKTDAHEQTVIRRAAAEPGPDGGVAAGRHPGKRLPPAASGAAGHRRCGARAGAEPEPAARHRRRGADAAAARHRRGGAARIEAGRFAHQPAHLFVVALFVWHRPVAAGGGHAQGKPHPRPAARVAGGGPELVSGPAPPGVHACGAEGRAWRGGVVGGGHRRAQGAQAVAAAFVGGAHARLQLAAGQQRLAGALAPGRQRQGAGEQRHSHRADRAGLDLGRPCAPAAHLSGPAEERGRRAPVRVLHHGADGHRRPAWQDAAGGRAGAVLAHLAVAKRRVHPDAERDAAVFVHRAGIEFRRAHRGARPAWRCGAHGGQPAAGGGAAAGERRGVGRRAPRVVAGGCAGQPGVGRGAGRRRSGARGGGRHPRPGAAAIGAIPRAAQGAGAADDAVCRHRLGTRRRGARQRAVAQDARLQAVDDRARALVHAAGADARRFLRGPLQQSRLAGDAGRRQRLPAPVDRPRHHGAAGRRRRHAGRRPSVHRPPEPDHAPQGAPVPERRAVF